MTDKRYVGPALYSKAGEATRAERVQAPWLVSKQRPCLGCRKLFNSPHAGVRICAICRRHEDPRS